MGDYSLFFLLALLAEIIGTVSGFGSSILFVPIASIFLDFKVVLGITAVFHVFSNLAKIYFFHQGIDKRIVIKLGVPAVIFVTIGALLTNYIPQKSIELAMNILVLSLALYLISRHAKTLKETSTNLYLGGTISGFLAGLIGTGGAVRGIILTTFNLEKNIFIATSAIIDLGVDSSRAAVYIAQGYFTQEHLKLIPFLILISIAGSYIGKLILKRIPEKTFHFVVLSVIALTSIVQTIRFFW